MPYYINERKNIIIIINHMYHQNIIPARKANIYQKRLSNVYC
jgi:hypothetical protein